MSNTGDWNTGNRNTGNSNTGNRNTGNSNTGNRNTGNSNTGNRNTGDWNTGDCNTGNRNTGNRNTGDWNTGNKNTGDRNTGYSNTGYSNTGNCNTGYCNTGNWNTGNCNTGNWNTGNSNTGYFCTDEDNVRIFNKPTELKRKDILFPAFFCFNLNEWILSENMSDKEKDEYPSHTVTGGYLKTYEYKEAWKKAWDGASEDDRKKVFDLPNFDAEIFKEITGIDVNASEKVKVVCEGNTVEISRESAKALNLL